ncbi:cytochrome b [Ancylobacter pratisalsi]|uniref:Cytochrome b n=1 Tax=Ancylobacter pratisalsi TaxID=1745854 RepID=A0A6P1YSJ2_9HYPH|nr:cytochrome b [Ancylobacter pratisalsi]QIB35850.1 cytochrome b [Ancylobacter pratisalsi]
MSRPSRLPVFPALSRLLHWLMAVMILAMLFIGIGMEASLSNYNWLLSVHRPLGIAILILAAGRLINRQFNPPPPLPSGMPVWLRFAAHASHIGLYGLMFAVPLIGWAMLSAARYPVVLYGGLVLPPILPQNDMVFAVLRSTHTVLAFTLFALILAHIGAALMHAIGFRDGVFQSMASVRRLRPDPASGGQ